MPERDKWDPIDSLGATGETVAHNIERLRTGKRLAFTELSARLAEVGRVIPTLGLRKIESGGRRVDADDLVALALALDVSPTTLLMPPAQGPTDVVAGGTGIGARNAENLWDWFGGNRPLTDPAQSDDVDNGEFVPFITRAWPRWKVGQLQREMGLLGGRMPDRAVTPWLTVEESSDGDDQ